MFRPNFIIKIILKYFDTLSSDVDKKNYKS
jgi:hypothetical protein